MLPLKDDVPSRHFPAATLLLIGLNVLAFLGELGMGHHVEHFLFQWGIVPVRYTRPEIAHFFGLYDQLMPFLGSMFLHGGWLHLIGNMWTLWIFGDNVEDLLGRGRFLIFYLLAGVIAAGIHIMTNAHSELPTIGASGAVAGVMGAYFRFYPHARVTMIIPPFFLGPFLSVPAVLFLGWWFFLQFFNGSMSLMSDPAHLGGIAWWAHVGGFIFGVLLSSSFARWRPTQRYHPEHFEWSQ